MLTQEERLEGQQMCMYIVLKNSYFRNFNKKKLQVLYESATSNNAKLLFVRTQQREIGLTPSEQIYFDMITVIYEESLLNPSIIEIFYDLYKDDFKKEHEYIRLAERQARHGGKHFTIPEKIEGLFVYFLVYRSKILDLTHFDEMDHPILMKKMKSVFGLGIDLPYEDTHVIYSYNYSIYKTKQYKRWVDRQINEMIDYINSSSELSLDFPLPYNLDVLLTYIIDKGGLVGGKEELKFKYGFPGVVLKTTDDAIRQHNGSIEWLGNLINGHYTSHAYNKESMVNLVALVDEYFKNLLAGVYQPRIVRGASSEIRPIDVAHCPTPSPEQNLFSLGFLYVLDLLCNQIDVLQEDYYRTFSFEKITEESHVSRFGQIIKKLEDKINELNIRLNSSLEENDFLREQINKNLSDSLIPYERELSAKNKEIELKNEQIFELKRQLQTKEEFIEKLQEEPVSDGSEDINLEELQQKRYLFVGHAREALPELRKTFPDSLFMETESFSLVNISVDAVVYLTKYMSHAMYYKTSGASSLSNALIIWVNTKNVETVYAAMAKYL